MKTFEELVQGIEKPMTKEELKGMIKEEYIKHKGYKRKYAFRTESIIRSIISKEEKWYRSDLVSSIFITNSSEHMVQFIAKAYEDMFGEPIEGGGKKKSG